MTSRWTAPNGFGDRYAIVRNARYRLERRFYKSHGQYRRHYQLYLGDSHELLRTFGTLTAAREWLDDMGGAR